MPDEMSQTGDINAGEIPYLSITVVHLTTGEALLPQKDVQNHRLFRNITTSFGDWTGGVLQIEEDGIWTDHDSRDAWVVLDARTTRHQVTMVHETRISTTYHTPQQLHRFKKRTIGINCEKQVFLSIVCGSKVCLCKSEKRIYPFRPP